jgi:hypothetical protein
MWVLGIREKGRRCYWRLFVWTLLRKPKCFTLSITLAIQGFHFRKVAEKIRVPSIRDMHDLQRAKIAAKRT